MGFLVGAVRDWDMFLVGVPARNHTAQILACRQPLPRKNATPIRNRFLTRVAFLPVQLSRILLLAPQIGTFLTRVPGSGRFLIAVPDSGGS